MKRLRNIISWILIFTLCCGEFVPATAVYAAGTEVTQEEAAVSEDDAVSEDAAITAEEENKEDTEVSENEIGAPVEENQPAEDNEEEVVVDEQVYEDGRVSGDKDVDAEEVPDDEADSFVTVSFTMKVDEKEARKCSASINELRKSNNKDELKYDCGLEEQAERRAAEAAIYFSNTRPDGRECYTILNDSVRGKAKREMLYRGGSSGADAAAYLKSLSSNELIKADYAYIAVGHVVFQGTHYWAVELTASPTNLSDKSEKTEERVYRIDLLEKYMAGSGADPELETSKTIKVSREVEYKLPGFKGYIMSKEHKPEKDKLYVVNPKTTWSVDKKYGKIVDNTKLKATAEEGTDFNISAEVIPAKDKVSFTYKVHVIVHVTSISISIDSLTVPLDETTLARVSILPTNADDKSFVIKSDNDNVIRVKEPKGGWPAKNNDKTNEKLEVVLEGAGAGTTKVWAIPNDTFNKNVKSSLEVTVDGEDQMCEAYAEPRGGYINKPTKVRLTCGTVGADIYYLIYYYTEELVTSDDGEPYYNRVFSAEDMKKSEAVYDPNRSDWPDNKYFTLYTDPITVPGNCYVRTVAVKKAYDSEGKETYRVSDHLDWFYGLNADDWGDVIVIDRQEYEKPEDLPAGLWVAEASMPEVSYTGKALKPDNYFRVYFNNRRLNIRTDYTIKYSNNVNASTDSSKANARFTFKGNFNAVLDKQFSIAPASVSAAQVAGAGAVYTGSPVTPKLKLTLNGKKLKEGVDYTVELPEGGIKDAGEYYITIIGRGNYCDKLIHKFTVAGSKKELPPADKLVSFKKDVTITLSQTVYDFLPDGCYPDVTVKASNGSVLTQGVDYLVTYKNCNKAGNASVVVTGLESAGYKGSKAAKFKINKVDINGGSVEVAQDIMSIYQKGGSKMEITVTRKLGDNTVIELREGIDYTVKYSNNKKAANMNAQKAPSYVVVGKGGYKGKTGSRKFSILPQNIGLLEGTAPDVVYSSTVGAYKCKPVIVDTNGKKLKAGTDYDTKDVVYRYDENCYVDVKGKSKQEFRKAGEAVHSKAAGNAEDDLPDAGTLLQVRINAKGNYTGYIRIRYRIVAQNISKYKANIADQQYTGEAIVLNKEDIRFTNGLKPEEFEIVGYSNNVEAGTAKVVLRGVGNYGGTLTVKFNIVKLQKDSWIKSVGKEDFGLE